MSEKQPHKSAETSPDAPRLEIPIPFSGKVGKYHRRKPQQFGAPRRFGIGTILIVMGAVSLLMALLIARGIPAVAILHIVGFTTLIGFAQVFLFKGQDPRKASLVAGAVICPMYALGLNIFLIAMGSRAHPEEMTCSIVALFILGPLLGYLAGGIVGGVFLIMDAWEKKFGRKDHAAEFYDPFAPEPGTAELVAEDEEEDSSAEQ